MKKRILFLVMACISINALAEQDTVLQQECYTVLSPYDSLELAVCEMRPQTAPIAVVHLVHGLCGCKERFYPFMQYLVEHGVVCVASDIRGHGDSIRSEEDRGYMYQGGVEAVVMDIEAVSSDIRRRYSDIPFVLLGHSMGSLAVRAYAKKYDEYLDALVLCGSPSPNPLAPIGKCIVKGMCKKDEGRSRPQSLQSFASRNYNRKFQKEGFQAWTCSDPQVRQRFAEDPRCNFQITADCGYTLMNLMQEVYSKKGWCVANQDLPIFFLSGDDDACMISLPKFNKVVNDMRRLGYTQVQSKLYEGMRHEILNEVEKELVWADILEIIRNK